MMVPATVTDNSADTTGATCNRVQPTSFELRWSILPETISHLLEETPQNHRPGRAVLTMHLQLIDDHSAWLGASLSFESQRIDLMPRQVVRATVMRDADTVHVDLFDRQRRIVWLSIGDEIRPTAQSTMLAQWQIPGGADDPVIATPQKNVDNRGAATA